MKTASWPYSPTQCPECRYFQSFDPPIEDDDGYDVLGFCRHPRIAMELFELKRRDGRDQPRCPCFLPKAFISRG